MDYVRALPHTAHVMASMPHALPCRHAHRVSWQNSTVRDTCHLPALDPEVVRRGRGVVREDPLQEGFFHAGKQGGQGQGDHGDAQQSGNTQGAGAVPNGAAVGAAGGAEEGRAARATAALMEGLRHAPLLAPGEGGGQGEARSGGVGGGAAPEVVLEAAAMMCPETPQQVGGGPGVCGLGGGSKAGRCSCCGPMLWTCSLQRRMVQNKELAATMWLVAVRRHTCA